MHLSIKKIILKINYIFKIGFSSFLFRFFYELKKKSGLFYLQDFWYFKVKTLEYDKSYFSIFQIINKDYVSKKSFVKYADNSICYEILTFSHRTLDYSIDGKMQWNYNPLSKILAPQNIPWYKIPDFGKFGDIKVIWEVSRFPQLYHLICAYSETKDEKYGKAARNFIIDWINQNPYPYGVNYKCGQEISFRLFSWILALDYFSIFFSSNDRELIIKNIQISLRRIWINYNYASKWVRNNHSISEAAGLLIGGLVFPGFSESKKYVKIGTSYLVEELNYQVSNDGAYIQHSFNYHRLVIDTLSFVILVSDRAGYQLPQFIREQHLKLIKFLTSFVMPNGSVPNYGPNDGALLFPVSYYSDYRPSLNFASLINNKTLVFDNGFELCDFFDFDYNNPQIIKIAKANYPESGYYHIGNERYDCFLRCHEYKSRPTHSDALHLDVWVDGINIFCDAGTYSYNTSFENRNQFSGIFGHNTIVINDEDYMKSLFNFGKSNWPDGRIINYGDKYFLGEHYGYRSINSVVHRREVSIIDNSLIVRDYLTGISTKTKIKQLWRTDFSVTQSNEHSFIINNIFISSSIKGKVQKSKISRYYNSFSECSQIIFSEEIESDFIVETTFIITK